MTFSFFLFLQETFKKICIKGFGRLKYEHTMYSTKFIKFVSIGNHGTADPVHYLPYISPLPVPPPHLCMTHTIYFFQTYEYK